MADVTVVIPVWNGAAHLQEQLDSLARQTTRRSVAVVVADNGSTDGSLQLARRADLGRVELTVLDASDRAGQAHARNAGAHLARGRDLLFVDQDDVVDPGYVEAMGAALDRHPLVAARLVTSTLNPPWLAASRTVPQEHDLGRGFGYLPYAAGGSLGVHRSVFTRVGGFDVDMPGAAEDVDLCWRVQEATGEALAYVPDAVLHYRYRPELAAIFRQGRSYARAESVLRDRYAAVGLPARKARADLRPFLGLSRRLVLHRRRTDAARLAWLLGHVVGRR